MKALIAALALAGSLAAASPAPPDPYPVPNPDDEIIVVDGRAYQTEYAHLIDQPGCVWYEDHSPLCTISHASR